MTKLVYLDSSDFSRLSLPAVEQSAENQAILVLLRESKRAGTATFFMSAVHLSEAVHAAAEHKDAAVRRAELIRELCGTNILRLPTDIPKLELKKALAGDVNARLTLDEIRSIQGAWLGAELPLDGMTDNRANVRRRLIGLFDNLPRRERRRRQSELDFEKRHSKERWRKILKSGARSASVPYPYNLVDEDTVIGWLLGDITHDRFRSETLKIIQDPYILFKHLVDENDHRQTLYESLRKQGRAIADSAEAHDQELIDALLPSVNGNIVPDIKNLVDRFFSLPKTMNRIITSFDVTPDQVLGANLQNIIRSCPSLHLFADVYRSRLLSHANSYLSRLRIGNTAVKSSNPSDFGDIMHCYYAPYLDMFRCDARFGAILKQHKPVKARIADRIGDIARMLIEDRRDVA